MENLIVWKTDQSNQWRLYNNSDFKLPPSAVTTSAATKETTKPPVDTPFHFTKARTETKGSIAYTPKGYGIVHSFQPDNDIATVKVEGTVYEFDKNQVTNEVPIIIAFLKGSVKVEETMYLPVTATSTDIHSRAENSVVFSDEEAGGGVKLYYQGKELDKSTETLEKLRVMANARFLAVPALGKPLSIKRFPTTNSGWYYDTSSVDGICITATKNIRLKGFSLYRGEQGIALNAEIKIIQGDNTKANVLYSETMSITPDLGGSDDKICQIMLGKTLNFKAGEPFSITMSCKEGHSHYGSGGNATVDGEGDVQFSFKECSGAHNGTSSGSGQIPELFYYV